MPEAAAGDGDRDGQRVQQHPPRVPHAQPRQTKPFHLNQN